MLDLLLKFGRTQGLVAEPGFAPKTIKWAIEFASDGRFLEVHELGDTEAKKNPGREFARCPDMSQPELVGGCKDGARCHFLAETTQVVTLLHKPNDPAKTIERTEEKHSFFIRLLQEAAEAQPELGVAARLLSNEQILEEIRTRLKEKKAKSSDKVTLLIEGSFPIDSTLWNEFWRSFRENLSDKKESVSSKHPPFDTDAMRCFVTGKLCEPVRTHLKIAGLANVGGLQAGDSLIGYDKASFRSYGFSQSLNAAVSEQAMAEYRSSLNHLIREHGRKLAGAIVVSWYKQSVPPEDDPLAWLEVTPEQDERNAQARAEGLLTSIREGGRPDLAGNNYFALTMSGASGRVMVRDWMEGAFTDLVRNVMSWFEDLSIVHREGTQLASNPKFLAVVASTVREIDELSGSFVTQMWHTAATGAVLPAQAMANALSRVRLDFINGKNVSHARFGLLKAFLNRNLKHQKEFTVEPYLNENHPNAAYHCGRLMSVLSDLQYNALGDVGAGVVQRYYAAASSTPALVLGRLIRTAQFHLEKSRAAGAFQKKIGSVMSRFGNYIPATLTLEEQTLFALGFYQQMAHDRYEAAQRKAEKQAANENDQNE
ncbi:type I-C CRISPR-associated protein Cas8c/Csd1 [bacterium]|nr:type I-C CRISPR-associated protein Cas8c/Csd1 [candidate division CSSED10-310 bacterium]